MSKKLDDLFERRDELNTHLDSLKFSLDLAIDEDEERRLRNEIYDCQEQIERVKGMIQEEQQSQEDQTSILDIDEEGDQPGCNNTSGKRSRSINLRSIIACLGIVAASPMVIYLIVSGYYRLVSEKPLVGYIFLLGVLLITIAIVAIIGLAGGLASRAAAGFKKSERVPFYFEVPAGHVRLLFNNFFSNKEDPYSQYEVCEEGVNFVLLPWIFKDRGLRKTTPNTFDDDKRTVIKINTGSGNQVEINTHISWQIIVPRVFDRIMQDRDPVDLILEYVSNYLSKYGKLFRDVDLLDGRIKEEGEADEAAKNMLLLEMQSELDKAEKEANAKPADSELADKVNALRNQRQEILNGTSEEIIKTRAEELQADLFKSMLEIINGPDRRDALVEKDSSGMDLGVEDRNIKTYSGELNKKLAGFGLAARITVQSVRGEAEVEKQKAMTKVAQMRKEAAKASAEAVQTLTQQQIDPNLAYIMQGEGGSADKGLAFFLTKMISDAIRGRK